MILLLLHQGALVNIDLEAKKSENNTLFITPSLEKVVVGGC
jgi:hypothetical protein